MSNPLRILIIGAHPDDCDLKAGGVATLYTRLGHDVRFISVTNGESGHFSMSGPELAARRQAEAAAAGRVLGLRYEVLDYRDGRLQPTLEARFAMIKLIREYRPDLVLTHRPNDYHPDHRYTSQLVCDAAYMVTVPPIVPEVPHLLKNPVIAYLSDDFQRPYPFSPTVVVDVEPVFDKIIDMLDCHESQFYEWMPYNGYVTGPFSTDRVERRQQLESQMRHKLSPLADRHRDLVVQTYGPDRGHRIKLIEAFEPCEYGAPLNEENRHRLFPFFD